MNPHTPTHILGWTLLHFLWQGSALAVIHLVAERLLKHRSAQSRYVMGCVILSLMAVSPFVTSAVLTNRSIAMHQGFSPMISPTPPANPVPSPTIPMESLSTSKAFGLPVDALMPVIVAFWFIGVVVLSLRILGGMRRIRRLSKYGLSPTSEAITQLFAKLCAQLGIQRQVALMQSTLVDVPTVMGWFSPIVLLPASTVSGLSPAQIQTILAHELAHVRRHDYLVNLLQHLLETMLFYHPAVWWVSDRVRQEREECCDDVVISLCGDRAGYAAALLALEEGRPSRSYFALGATDGTLLERVRRLLRLDASQSPAYNRRFRSLLWFLAILALAGTVLAQWVRPPVYRAVARVILEVPKTGTGESAASTSTESQTFDPYRLQTQVDVVLSLPTLQIAVADLLNGSKTNSNQSRSTPPIPQEEWIARALQLRQQVSVKQVGSTSLLEICAEDAEPHRAAQIANAVAAAYITVTVKSSRAQPQGTVQLTRLLDQLNASVAQGQEDLQKLREELDGSVPEAPKDSSSNQSPSNKPADEPRGLATSDTYTQNRAEAEVKRVKANLLLKSLSNTPNAQDIILQHQLDAHLPALLEQKSALQLEIAELTVDLAPSHPKRLGLNARQEALNEQIRQRLNAVATRLNEEIAFQAALVDRMDQLLKNEAKSNREFQAKWQVYFETKRSVEALRSRQKAFQLQLLQDQIDADTIARASVALIDRAEPPVRPIRRWF